MGSDVVLVSSAEETAFAVERELRSAGLLRDGTSPAIHRFLSSGDISWFADLGSRLLGPELSSADEWSVDTVALPPLPSPR